MEMGRRRKGRGKGAEQSTEHSRRGLEEPWSSAPKRPARYALYCFNEDKNRRYIETAYALYAIKKIFEAVVDGEEYKWLKTTEICLAESGIRIRSDKLEEIIEYEYTEAEEAWEPGVPYTTYINQLKHGERIADTLEQAERNERGELKVTSKKASTKPRASRDGLVTVQAIAEELGVLPRDARGVLRAKKLQKPAAGWAWSEKEAEDIKKMLQSELSGGKKPKKSSGKKDDDGDNTPVVIKKKRKLVVPGPDDAEWSGDPKDRRRQRDKLKRDAEPEFEEDRRAERREKRKPKVVLKPSKKR